MDQNRVWFRAGWLYKSPPLKRLLYNKFFTRSEPLAIPGGADECILAEASPLSEYNSSTREYPPSTLSVWKGESIHFLSFNPLVEGKENDSCMACLCIQTKNINKKVFSLISKKLYFYFILYSI